MATDLGQLVYTLTLNAEGFDGQVDAASGSMDTLAGSADESSAAMDKQAASATEAGAATRDAGAAAGESEGMFASLGDTLKDTVLPLVAMFGLYEGGKDILHDIKDATDEYQQSNAQLTQTLNNTHDAIGLTVKQLDDLADSTSKGTTIAAGQNLTVEQTLLGYSAVNKEALPQTISLVDDLATRMAKGGTPSTQQLSTASKELGKAMEDPATGMTAFTRAMVTFTPAQTDAVKAMEAAGNTAGAQKLIMQDLTGVVGGDATAATHTFAGSVQELRNELEPTELAIGQGFDSAMGKIGSSIGAALPAIEDLIKNVINYLKPAFDDLGRSFENLMPALERMEPLFRIVAEVAGVTIVVAFKAMLVVMATVINVVATVIKFFENHRLALVALAGAIGAVLIPVLTMMAIDFAISAAAAVASAIAMAAAWIAALAPFVLVGAAIAAIAYEVVTHWDDVKQWFDDFWNFMKGIFNDGVNFIKNNWQLLLDILLGPVGVVLALWHYFHDQIIEIFDDVVHAIEAIWDGIVGFIGGIITDVKNAITTGVKDFGTLLEQAGKDLINGLINGIKDTVGDVENAVKGVGKAATDAAKDVLKIFSPSQVFSDIGMNVTAGLAQGITGNSQAAVAATQSVTGAITQVGNALPGSINSPSSASAGQQVNYNFAAGAVVLSTAEAVDEFYNVGNRNTQLELAGGAPLAGTTGV